MNLIRPSLNLLLLSVALTTGQMALAQTPTGPAGAASVAKTSSQFKAAYNMASLSIGGVALSKEVKDLMRDQLLLEFAENVDFQVLELDYPGITVAVVEAVLPVAVRHTEQNSPALIERLATLYAAEMTADEIAVATEWFSSPAFARISASMESNMDLSKIIKDAVAGTGSQVSGEDLEAVQNDSLARSSSKMTSADRATLLRFSETPAYAKLETLKPKSQQIETAWTNEVNPAHDTELENMALTTMEEFTGLDLGQ